MRLPDAPGDASPGDIRIDGGEVVISWSDGETTRHAAGWLRDNCSSATERARRKHVPAFWDGATAAAMPWFDAAELDDETVRLEFFLSVLDFGFARLRNVPVVSGSVGQIAELLGPIHETGYGRLFDVRVDSTIRIGANSSRYLGPHTDENYRHAPPGITLFHCLVAHAGGGGESLLVDGFMAAHRLAQRDPEAFDLLSRVPLAFRRGGAEDREDSRAFGKVICTDLDGDIVGIRYTDRTIPPLDLPSDLIGPMYRALRAWATELYRPDLTLRYALRPGELHVFDNQRVLHGRSAFDASVGSRHLQQCAVDRDEFHSSLRMLAWRCGHPVADLVMAGGALG